MATTSSDGTIKISTSVDSSGAEKGIKGLVTKIKSLGKSVGSALTKFGFIAQGMDYLVKSVKAVTGEIKKFTDAAQVQEQAELKLETVMRQRMGANEEMIQSVKDLASEQQKLGVVGDEVQLAGAQQLSTFLNTDTALKKLIPAMNNLAVQQNGLNVTSESMVSIGNLMGKVMQGQVSALSRVGITFSEAQEQILKYGTEEQKAATLAQVITDNVGEMNQAFANTPYGRMQQIKNNLGDVMETIGMGMQNFIIPFLGALDRMVQKLAVVAEQFKRISELITGNKAEKSIVPTTNAINDSADATEDLTDVTNDNTGATKKNTKEKNRSLSTFDKLNVISKQNTDSDSGGISSGNSTPTSTSPMNSMVNEATKGISELSNKLQELANSFKNNFMEGFNKALGKDFTDKIGTIKRNCSDIKTSVLDIFNDENVQNSAKNYVDSTARLLGTLTGTAARIGTNIGVGLTGGIADLLQQKSPDIKNYLSGMLDIGSEINDLQSQFALAIGTISDAFASEEFQNAVSNFGGIFYELGSNISLLCAKIKRDFLEIVITPISDNAEGLRDVLTDVFGFVGDIFGTLNNTLDEFGNKLQSVYDEHLKPFFDDVAKGFSSILSHLITFWKTYMEPFLTWLTSNFDKVMKNHITPLLNNLLDVVGEVIDVVDWLWKKVLVPLINWVIDKILPTLLPIFKSVLQAVSHTVSNLADFLNGFLTSFKGIIQIIKGILTGDWQKIWEGAKNFVFGIIKMIVSILKGLGQTALDLVNITFQKFIAAWKIIWNTVTGVLKTAVNIVIHFLNMIISGLNSAINGIISLLNGFKISIPSWVPTFGGQTFGFNLSKVSFPKIPALAQGAVIPGGAPFLAMLGDQKKGQTNIETPLPTMKQAFKEAISEMGMSGGGEYTFVAQIDGKEIFRETIKQDKLNKKRTGKSAFAY